MFSSIAALAIALAALMGPTPAYTTGNVEAAHCDTMGEAFQCDEERAMEAMEPFADIYAENFRVNYLTTRVDGAEPVDGDLMVHVQDKEFPNMYHVYTLTYTPTIHNV